MVYTKGDPKAKLGGRPKGAISIVHALKERLAEENPEIPGSTLLDRAVDIILEKSLKEKDVTMLRDMIDRVDGKPTQNLGGEMSLTVNIKKYDGN